MEEDKNMEFEAIVKEALHMREFSYVPYSHFRVGAALMTEDGKLYTGCNIENAAYTPSNCAERTAFFKAVSEGERKFTAIAIAGGAEDAEELEYCSPCGVCRQVMREFCGGDFVIAVTDGTDIREHTLDEIMPYSFSPADLSRGNEK